MEDEAGVPSPPDSGSDGSQVSADPIPQRILHVRPSMPMVERLVGLAATNSPDLGGVVSSALIAGIASQMESELQQTKADLALLREKAERLANDLANERIEHAIKTARLKAFESTRNLKYIGVAMGTFLLSHAYKASQSGHIPSAIIPAIVGGLLLYFSWFSSPHGGEK